MPTLIDTDTQEVTHPTKRTGASQALRELFDADWPDLPDKEEALKILQEIGIRCSDAVYYVVRKRYIGEKKIAELLASQPKPQPEPVPPAEPVPAVAVPVPATLPPSPEPEEELPPMLNPPPGGKMETLIRVWGWVEQIGGIDKMYHWLEFYEDFVKRFQGDRWTTRVSIVYSGPSPASWRTATIRCRTSGRAASTRGTSRGSIATSTA
jgi:hypothetical protein